MGVKVFIARTTQDYEAFINHNTGIKFLNVTASPQGLVLTYLEDLNHLRKRKVCLSGYFGQEELKAMYSLNLPQFGNYFSSNEMTIIAVGTAVIFKFVVTPIEGSGWEQFASTLGLTLV